jgi:hypothetical protein
LIDERHYEGGPMEDIDHDGWARLVDAVREVNGKPAVRPEHETTVVAIKRPVEATANGFAGRNAAWLAARVLGALGVLAVGAVHLQQYETLYSAIPTIGPLFVLNFAGATAIGLGLLAPLDRILGRRWGGVAVGILSLAGVGLAATAFAFLAISEQTPLFGFMEPGYDPGAILASRVAEGVTVVSLGTYLIARFVVRAPTGRW